ncbi:MAG: thiamine pyrophosphate-dependent enzyme [Alphaproteobacteria bacterium]
MTRDPHIIAEEVLRVRIGQLLVNEILKRRELKVPVHLALGHEAIAVAVSEVMGPGDRLCLTHRNIHYNLARAQSFAPEVAELRLSPEGIGGGRLGSMNMANPGRGILYTSSILANDLCVATGVALGGRLEGGPAGATFVVTGDGAMEEGAFYETLELAKSLDLPVVVVVENNGWSLASRIHERRCPIAVEGLAAAFAVPFASLRGNDAIAYVHTLERLRARAIGERTPVIVEAHVSTLGDWRGEPTPAEPEGRVINYHHGAAATVTLGDVMLEGWPVIREDATDPVHVLTTRVDEKTLRAAAWRLLSAMTGEIA